MIRRWRRLRRRTERGAVAIFVAALAIVLFMAAALAVDISKQVNYKHELQNQLDAAAVAAGYYLETKATGCDPARPSASCLRVAVENAQDFYQRNYSETLDVRNIDFWCVVARRHTTTTPRTPTNPAQAAFFQIPTSSYGAGVCNPDAAPSDTNCDSSSNCFQEPNYRNRTRVYDNTRFDMTCSGEICAIPCALRASESNNWTPGRSSMNNQHITCNTIRVSSERGVPFSFAPAGGINEGSTGQQTAVACKGSCGAIAVNPMDVVVVADRTPSMSPVDRLAMVNGIRSMLEVMTPAQQFVSLGTISRSMTTNRSTAGCPTPYNNGVGGSIRNESGGLTFPTRNALQGQWIPLKFYDDYLDRNGNLNGDSNIARALNCIEAGNSYDGGTTLGAPLKAAARYVLGRESNNINSELNGSRRVGEIRKVVIFETDGQPQEWTGSPTGAQNSALNSDTTSLSDSSDNRPLSDFRRTTSEPINSTTTNDRGVVNRGSLGISPTPPANYTNNSRNSYNITYRQRQIHHDNRDVVTAIGGQQACRNFQGVASAAKAEGVLIITIGYNLDSSNMCGGSNVAGSSNSNSSTTHYISALDRTGANWSNTTQRNNCRSGSGTPSNPYVLRTATCTVPVTITVTSTTTQTGSIVSQGPGDQRVTDVLASAAGGKGLAPSSSNGCATADARAEENSDGDYFFCAASGDDMGPIFQTALSQVTTGVKLLSGLPR